MHSPKNAWIQVCLQIFQGSVIGLPRQVFGCHRDGAVRNIGKNNLFGVYKEIAVFILYQELGFLLSGWRYHTQKVFKPIIDHRFGFKLLLGTLNRLFKAGFFYRLQDVIHRVDLEGLHCIVVIGSNKHQLRQFVLFC